MSGDRRFDAWEKSLPHSPIIDRDSWILDLCRGRSVIHLGACDAPMAREKAETGTLLHQKLATEAASLVGIDSDRASIELLARDFGIVDILDVDLSAGAAPNIAKADVVVCADIIEHVNNVGALIRACGDFMREDGLLVLTTINALSIKQALRALLRREPVHPDHVAYYSYATIGGLLSRFGLRLEDCRYAPYATVSGCAGMLFSGIYWLAPQCADAILVTARKQAGA